MPHNLISAQESPVPLPKLQKAPRLKNLISSGSKKGTRIYYPFFPKSPGKRIPSRFPNGAPKEIDNRLQGIFTSLLTQGIHFYVSLNTRYLSYCLSLRVPGKGAPSVFPNRVPADRDTPSPEPLAKQGDSIHSFMYVSRRPQKGALLHT